MLLSTTVPEISIKLSVLSIVRSIALEPEGTDEGIATPIDAIVSTVSDPVNLISFTLAVVPSTTERA